MNLKQIILETDTKAGRNFDLFIQVLIIFSLVTFSIETLPNLSEATLEILGRLEMITIAIFSVEYVLRVSLNPNRLKYIISFYGLIDLVAIIPFYLQTGLDLRSIRVFRLLRLFRIFKLFRYGSAIKTFTMAFKKVKSELIIFFIATLFVLYVAAVGIYYFESRVQPEQFGSVFHSLWWAVATLTTVGYGDSYPITIGGKIFTTIIVLIGLGVVAIPTGLLASAMTDAINEKK